MTVSTASVSAASVSVVGVPGAGGPAPGVQAPGVQAPGVQALGGAPFANRFHGQDVVVTGHTGFKGSWLTLWLTHLGARVHGYALPPPSTPSLFEMARLDQAIDHTLGDVRDLERFAALLQRTRPAFVFHLAAQAIVSLSYSDPVETISTNVMGTTMVLEALRRVTWPCAAVLITSDKCYHNVEWPWGYRETDRLGGKDVYSGSKGAAEIAIGCYLHAFFSGGDHPVRLAVGRAGNVIGGGDWAADRIVVDCIKAWMAGRRVQLRSPRCHASVAACPGTARRLPDSGAGAGAGRGAPRRTLQLRAAGGTEPHGGRVAG